MNLPAKVNILIVNLILTSYTHWATDNMGYVCLWFFVSTQTWNHSSYFITTFFTLFVLYMLYSSVFMCECPHTCGFQGQLQLFLCCHQLDVLRHYLPVDINVLQTLYTSAPPQYWHYRLSRPCLTFIWMMGIQTQILCLDSMHITLLTMSLAPRWPYFFNVEPNLPLPWLPPVLSSYAVLVRPLNSGYFSQFSSVKFHYQTL